MKVLALATHPIQYQIPLFRALSMDPDIDFTALFLSDHSVKGGFDSGFGRAVQWDVPILAGYDYKFLENTGKKNLGSGFFAYHLKEVKKVLKEQAADVLLLPGHSVFAYWQALRASKLLGMKTVVRPESLTGVQRKRSWLKKIIRKYALNWFYGKVDIFCSTGHFASIDAKYFGFSDKDTFFSPYNIDSDFFEKQRSKYWPQRELIREELGMQNGDVGLVFSGKFIDWKNPDLILDALQLLEPDIKARIFPIFIGDGSNYQELQGRCRSIFPSRRFSMPGFVNQSLMGKYYVAGDLFVLPSKRGHESWGLVVNEAMIFGLPCLVSDGVGSRLDLVHEGKTGYIFEDGDVRALANKITEFVKNPLLRQEMGRAAYTHIQSYSQEKAIAGVKKALVRAKELKMG